MSAFDPQAFLDAQQNEVNTKRPPLPTENPDDPNGLYTAVIGEIKPVSGIIGKGDRAGQPWLQMVVPLRIQVPAAVQALGIPPEVTLTDRPMIDITPQGSIDNSVGKNRGQRTYREATGTNKPGEAFAWRMLQGKVVKVKIDHELYQDAVMERVKNVLAA